MAPVCVANTLGTLERPAADGCAEDAACPVSAFYAAQAYSRLHQVQPGHATPSSLSVGVVTAARPALVSIAAMVFLAPALAAFAQRRVRTLMGFRCVYLLRLTSFPVRVIESVATMRTR